MISRRYTINIYDIFNLIIITLLFLLSMNFMNKFNYIIIAMFFLTLMNMLLRREKVYITLEFLVLWICFSSYFITYVTHFEITLHMSIVYWLGPLIGYFTGIHIVNILKKISLDTIIMIMVLGLFTHGMLNMNLYFQQGINGRTVPDIWLGYNRAATLQGILFTLICSLLFYALFICRKKYYKYLIILGTIISIYCTLQTASRTLLVISIICFIFNFLLYVYLNKDKRSKVIKMVIYILLFLCIIVIFYKFNILNIKSIYKESPLYERMKYDVGTVSLGEDPRLKMSKAVFIIMFKYPFGGNKITEISYAHNLWLDSAKTVGIIPFFLLMTYTLFTIITMFKLLNHKYVQSEYKYILFSIYVSLMINFMVEPILEGMPNIFIIMCIINGITNGIRYKLNSKN